MKRTFSKNPEHPKIPRPRILSDLCRNFTLILVWILSESLSEFWSEFWFEICLNFCLTFAVWLLSELSCLNFAWILSEFCCLNLAWILSEFCLNFVVWILSEFSCLNFVWILSELTQDTRKGREAKKWGSKINFSQQNFGIEAFTQWPRIKWPLGKAKLLDAILKIGVVKKGKHPKKQDWGHSGPSGFFWGDVMDLSSSFF